VKEIGCHGEISLGREPVAVTPQIGARPEHVVKHDDARPRAIACGFREIGLNVAAAGRDDYIGHSSFSGAQTHQAIHIHRCGVP